ncbi:MAG: peptide chain release factor N(5)-glutamine methyltransferase [Lachnospiraceae bacterium]|nr:peptide chain release factor N(5)-glutamine methyltransferase [Lachnospiraceae bacterium]
MTLFQLLAEGSDMLQRSGSPDAQNDARQLLLAAFETDMVHFLLKRMQELEENEDSRSRIRLYREMIERRRSRIPLQQILGCQEFMGLDFYVNEHVLIPRQDTETLVELVLEEQKDPEKSILDVCTGSGCIAISLAVKGGYPDVTATDISEEALKVARRNAAALQCDEQVHFYQGDLFGALEQRAGRTFDIIVSNPPYIPTAVIRTLEPEVRDHEPLLALDGTEDGLHYYRRIASEAGKYLKPDGRIYLEIGYDQGKAVSELLTDAGFFRVRVCQDLPGKDRVVCAVWPGQQEACPESLLS